MSADDDQAGTAPEQAQSQMNASDVAGGSTEPVFPWQEPGAPAFPWQQPSAAPTFPWQTGARQDAAAMPPRPPGTRAVQTGEADANVAGRDSAPTDTVTTGVSTEPPPARATGGPAETAAPSDAVADGLNDPAASALGAYTPQQADPLPPYATATAAVGAAPYGVDAPLGDPANYADGSGVSFTNGVSRVTRTVWVNGVATTTTSTTSYRRRSPRSAAPSRNGRSGVRIIAVVIFVVIALIMLVGVSRFVLNPLGATTPASVSVPSSQSAAHDPAAPLMQTQVGFTDAPTLGA